MGASGEWAAGGTLDDILRLGDEVTFHARHFGVPMRLTAVITAHSPPDRFIEAMLAAGRADLRPHLANIRCTTLVLVGTRDRVNRAAARRVHRGVEGSEFSRVTGGHALNSESITFHEVAWAFLAAGSLESKSSSDRNDA